jgi:hypothetical protein
MVLCYFVKRNGHYQVLMDKLLYGVGVLFMYILKLLFFNAPSFMYLMFRARYIYCPLFKRLAAKIRPSRSVSKDAKLSNKLNNHFRQPGCK